MSFHKLFEDPDYYNFDDEINIEEDEDLDLTDEEIEHTIES